MPNSEVPSLRSVTTNVHAPVPPGTLSVGVSEDDTHPVGVSTAPVHTGTRSPVPVAAGRAANVVGSPAAADAPREAFDVDEHAVARSASARPTATIATTGDGED